MKVEWVDKGIAISAEKFPDKKRPAICIEQSGFTTVYGYFHDDESGELFIKKLAELVGAKKEDKQNEI